jgi:simple sugar transport system substrate-binding protein
MMKWASLAAAAALAAGAASIGTASAQQEQVKACWIYVGPVGDHGWSYQHDQGRLHVEEVLGDKVETVLIENVAARRGHRPSRRGLLGACGGTRRRARRTRPR